MTPVDAVTARFHDAYGTDPDGVWAAPGRVNLIGEHTDYTGGFVLPMALEHRCVAAVSSSSGGSRLVSAQSPDAAPVAFRGAELTPGSVPGWAAYVAGVLWALRDGGHDVPDIDVVVDGNVPLGAGLSSSAALECVIATAVNDLAGLGLTKTELALVAQRAENGYVGAATGIMDQMASMHGHAGHLVFLDTRSYDVESVPFDLAASGLALLVVDTLAPHALVDGQYAERRRTCEEAQQILGVPALRDLVLADLDAALTRLPSEVMRRRVRHVVTENARVLGVVEHLRGGGDPRGIGPALVASHASLRDDFEVTVPHLDVAVDAALAAGAYGARMTGGGFGGSIIALVDAEAAGTVVAKVEAAYGERGYDAPVAFVAQPAVGAERLS